LRPLAHLKLPATDKSNSLGRSGRDILAIDVSRKYVRSGRIRDGRYLFGEKVFRAQTCPLLFTFGNEQQHSEDLHNRDQYYGFNHSTFQVLMNFNRYWRSSMTTPSYHSRFTRVYTCLNIRFLQGQIIFLQNSYRNLILVKRLAADNDRGSIPIEDGSICSPKYAKRHNSARSRPRKGK
jgi:hypothetical protein